MSSEVINVFMVSLEDNEGDLIYNSRFYLNDKSASAMKILKLGRLVYITEDEDNKNFQLIYNYTNTHRELNILNRPIIIDSIIYLKF